MSENEGQQNTESEGNPTGAEGAAGSSGDGSGGTQVPEGYVSREELAREQARTRAFQSERDRLQAQLRANEQGGNSGSGDGSGSDSFDPATFRRQILGDVMGVNALTMAAGTLRTEFPHADPALFTPDRLVEFASPEALRIAVEDSHTRVASIIETERKRIEAQIKADFDAANGGGDGGPQAPQRIDGDPTFAEFAALSLSEQDALEAKSPGITKRMLDATLAG